MVGHDVRETVRAGIRVKKVQGVDQGSLLSRLPPEGQRERVHAATIKKNERTKVCLKVYGAFPFRANFRSR